MVSFNEVLHLPCPYFNIVVYRLLFSLRWAIIGLTDQYLTDKLERNTYVLEMGNLQGHVTRHNHIRLIKVKLLTIFMLFFILS